MPDTTQFDADIQYKDNTLFIDYTVKNDADQDLYLVNRLFKTTPAWDAGPHIAYIKLDVDNRQIQVSKKIADIPSDKYVAAPVVPFVTPVRAGEEFAEMIQIPGPVKEYIQYGSRPIDENAMPTEFESVTFELGYYWRAEGTTEREQEVQGEPYIIPNFPPGVLPNFGVFKAGPVAVNIPVVMPKLAAATK